MLTTCCICSLPLAIPDNDDDGVWCVDCLTRNFIGGPQTSLAQPRIEVVGLGRRRAADERIAARHREEE